MQKTVWFTAFILIFLFLPNPVLISSQDPAIYKDMPSTLDEYDVVARGKMSRDRGKRPVQIARMDNNGEILLSCVESKTVNELKSSGINFLQSQLEFLIDWDLLEYDRKNKKYRTAIHVYRTEEAATIRQYVRTGVVQLESELDTELKSLLNHLDKIDREKNLFAILYAYVLHSYSMGQFGEEIYRKPQLTAENPFWNGYAWAIYPIKKFNTGVTFMPVEGIQFFVVSAATMPKLDFKQIVNFVKDFSSDNKIDNPKLIKSLSAFGLYDDQGNLTIPIFDGDWSAKLENMAKKVYAKTIELVESEEMKGILGMETQAQAAMFLHYEIRYAFLNYLLEKGTIIAPVDFKNADNNNPTDVKNLVFLMKNEKSD